jgi:hypothetical protein
MTKDRETGADRSWQLAMTFRRPANSSHIVFDGSVIGRAGRTLSRAWVRARVRRSPSPIARRSSHAPRHLRRLTRRATIRTRTISPHARANHRHNFLHTRATKPITLYPVPRGYFPPTQCARADTKFGLDRVLVVITTFAIYACVKCADQL